MPKAAGLSIDDELDAEILKAYDAWVRVLDLAIEETNAKGVLVDETPNGHQQKIPQLNVLADATKHITALAQQLGRTPASRVRLGVQGPVSPDASFADDEIGVPARFRNAG
jgi:P27 family predicted phage terminase small subunit